MTYVSTKIAESVTANFGIRKIGRVCHVRFNSEGLIFQEEIGTDLARNPTSVTKKSELNNNYFIPDFLNFQKSGNGTTELDMIIFLIIYFILFYGSERTIKQDRNRDWCFRFGALSEMGTLRIKHLKAISQVCAIGHI